MSKSHFSGSGRRVATLVLVGGSLLMAGCSEDAETPEDSPPGTLAEEEVLGQQPETPDDNSDGSGEGGNRTGEGDPAPGTGGP